MMALVWTSLPGAGALAAGAADLCETFGLVEVAGKTSVVQNNIWGAGTAQCLQVDDANGAFHVTRSAHRNATDGAPASYPSIFVGCHWGNCTNGSSLPMQVSAISSLTTSWNVTVPAAGAWNAAYDIWFHRTADVSGQPDGAEMMIWLNHRGGVQPAGTQVGTLSAGGATWEVWTSDFGWNYIAYRRTQTTASVSNLDLRPFIQDALSRGVIQPAWQLSGLEAGFELWQGGEGLRSNSFSASVAGGGAPPLPSPARPPAATPSPAVSDTSGAACIVTYAVRNEWPGGFTADLSIHNHGSAPINGWTLAWTFPKDQQIYNLWNGGLSQGGPAVSVRNLSYNAGIPPNGGEVTLGFNASFSGANARPAAFHLNGQACGQP